VRLATIKIEKEEIACFVLNDYLIDIVSFYKFIHKEDPPSGFFNIKGILSIDKGLHQIEELKDKAKEMLAADNSCDELIAKKIIFPLGAVKLTAPVPNPDKIVCIGLNYKDHCKEQNRPFPRYPILFSKFNTAVIGPNDVVIKPAITQKLDFEAELAFIIGKKGRHIEEKDAMEYVAGYTIFNDISARDIQFADKQWLRGKTFDTFAPMGPYLVTKDEIDNPHNLYIKVKVNDSIMQDSNTSAMIHQIPYLISFISQVVTLKPGDVVATGTPAGVGVFRKPPFFLKQKDTVSVEIEKLGVLRNFIEDDTFGG